MARPRAALLSRLDLTTPRSAYVARSTAAALLALAVAYLLELDTPFSAASTVLLVINPVQGAVIGKGAWRIIGTLVGMLAAVALMAVAGQQPLLFVLGFGAWPGLCVAAMTLLRHFRASGAVVAGYTIGLATYGAMGHPEHTFEHVMGRGATVMIGVVCLGLVSSLFSARTLRARLHAHYQRLAANVAGAIARQQGAAPAEALAARQALIADVYGVDDLLAAGKAESEDLAQRAAAVRNGMAALFSALIGGTPARMDEGSAAQALAALRAPLRQAWEDASQALTAGDLPRAAGLLRQARQSLIDALSDLRLADARQEATLLIAAERLGEQLDAYLDALDGLAALAQPRPPAGAAPVRFHRDYASAVRNGLRSMAAILLAGLFWLWSGWTDGDMMLLVLAPYCSLLATAGDPPAGARAFLRGCLYAVPAAWVCAFGVLPHLDGFALLAVALAVFWLPGILATSSPRTAFGGLAYLVAFNTLTAADNPMQYSMQAFANHAVAWVLATSFALLCFQVILPRHPGRDIARLRRVIRDDSLALLRGKRPADAGWQQRQQHRVAQLGALLKGRPAQLADALAQSLAALRVGLETQRIQRLLANRALPPQAQRLAQAGLDRLARGGAPRPAGRNMRAAPPACWRGSWAWPVRNARPCRRPWPPSPTSTG
ncbi:FUSC family protein [Achromobacter insuavis]